VPSSPPDEAEGRPGWGLERLLWSRGYGVVAGVDEAGRGALAGPVVAAAVVLPFRATYPFDDSKRLKAAQREAFAVEIKGLALAWGVGAASSEEVDVHNVLGATHLAAARALAALEGGFFQVDALVTDFLKLTFPGPVLAVPRGDSRSYQVAAASILAKTTRDRLMCDLGARYPAYGFAAHKGYGSPSHLRALALHGPSAVHRRSFAPVLRSRPPLFS